MIIYRYIGRSSESKPRLLLAVSMGIVRNKSATKAQSGTDLMSSKCMRSLAALGRTKIFTCFEPENEGFIVREMFGRNPKTEPRCFKSPFLMGGDWKGLRGTCTAAPCVSALVNFPGCPSALPLRLRFHWLQARFCVLCGDLEGRDHLPVHRGTAGFGGKGKEHDGSYQPPIRNFL